jgi:hypothetical protein
MVCSNRPMQPACSMCSSASGPRWSTASRSVVAHLPRDPSFASRDLSSIRRGNLFPILPDAVRPASPDLRHAMLGMTETGSVCLTSDDESDQPEHRRGSFGRPAPGFEPP